MFSQAGHHAVVMIKTDHESVCFLLCDADLLVIVSLVHHKSFQLLFHAMHNSYFAVSYIQLYCHE